MYLNISGFWQTIIRRRSAFDKCLFMPSTFAILFFLLLSVGCTSTPTTPDGTPPVLRPQLDLTVSADEDVNPDDKGRPSPIKVHIYELKSEAAFIEADYFTLNNQEKQTLGEDMLVSDVMILRPGESKTIVRKAQSATTVIGVVAGYQDLPNSTWSSIYKLPPATEASWVNKVKSDPKIKLKINLAKQVIRIIEPD